jgi:hypothetical protein
MTDQFITLILEVRSQNSISIYNLAIVKALFILESPGNDSFSCFFSVSKSHPYCLTGGLIPSSFQLVTGEVLSLPFH